MTSTSENKQKTISVNITSFFYKLFILGVKMNILLLNGGKAFGHSHGELNHTLRHNVKETVIDAGYDVEAEIEKFLWMDAVIWQMPVWWMHEPWTVKKYIDEVFIAGHGKLYHSDGRHRVSPTEGFGTGGLLQGKKHMLSLTWNAPIEAFTREGDFFEGKDVDAVYMPFHKLNEFIGLTRLPTFTCNDVVKNPQVEQYFADYQAHLKKVFG